MPLVDGPLHPLGVAGQVLLAGREAGAVGAGGFGGVPAVLGDDDRPVPALRGQLDALVQAAGVVREVLSGQGVEGREGRQIGEEGGVQPVEGAVG